LATEISQIVFRLSASGALAPGERDAELIGVAKEFISDPDAWVVSRSAWVAQQQEQAKATREAAQAKREAAEEEVRVRQDAAREARSRPKPPST
jgi:hypothetical protein